VNTKYRATAFVGNAMWDLSKIQNADFHRPQNRLVALIPNRSVRDEFFGSLRPSLTLFEVALFERAEGPTYRQPVAKATGTLRKKYLRPEGPTQQPVCRPFRPQFVDDSDPVARATGIGCIGPPGLICATSKLTLRVRI